MTASHRSKRLRKATYRAVLLQILKDKEFIKPQIITTFTIISPLQSLTVKTHIAHDSPNNDPTIQRASDIFLMLVSGKGGNEKERVRASGPSALFQTAVLSPHKQDVLMPEVGGHTHKEL